MFIHSISPILATIGPLQIRWYGLIYASSWLLTYYFLLYEVPRRKLMSQERVQEYFMYTLLAGVGGARLGSVLSELPYYLAHPADIIAIWKGGVAFHGGLIGVILISLWYFNKHKISFWKMADIIALPATLFLGFGRIGNFINAEFVGKPTSLPWGVLFPGFQGARHPAQLYEALMMFAIFALLCVLYVKKHKAGVLFAVFLVCYGIGRSLLEAFKDPAGVTHIGPLTWGQFWNIPMVLVGLYLLYKATKNTA